MVVMISLTRHGGLLLIVYDLQRGSLRCRTVIMTPLLIVRPFPVLIRLNGGLVIGVVGGWVEVLGLGDLVQDVWVCMGTVGGNP